MKSKKRRRILVPIDFSEESMKTLRLAKLLAERWRAQLDLLHVIPPSPSTSTLYPAMLPIAPSAGRTASADLKRLKDFAFEQSVQPLPYSCTIRLGAAAEEINEIARKTSTDLIAIATRGYTGIKVLVPGQHDGSSNANRALPRSGRPGTGVSLAKERARRGRTPLGFKKVLVPLDFSECSRVGLDYALGVAREFRSSLLLFHCVVPPTYALGAGHTALAGPKLIASQQEFAQDEMENLHRQLGEKSVEIEMFVGLGSPVEQIIECVRTHRVDVIVTSTHGRTGLKRLFIGSTAEQIVRHAICPVLVVPNRPSQKKPRKQPC